MKNLPTGTVTFLFTDIEGSTKLAQEHRDQWENLQQRHHAILQSAMDAYNGYVFQIIGDAFCVAFSNASDALQTAVQTQVNLHTENWGDSPIKVRMGIHTGKAELQQDGQYHGYLAMSRVQRVMSVAHGGQTLLSNACAELVRNELPEGVTLLDLKEHRLKGLLNPEHLWQAVAPNLPKDFPPLQSLNDIPNNLPIQLTSFIGREKEIAELKQELNTHHLVTLTGSGGTGKTRLSLQVAAEVIDSFHDGVWFQELAPVTDPALVPNTLANLIGLRESSETKQTITELICGYFRSRKALVVFDNCEHLIEACARFADLLLHSCKDVKILASSREALGVAGEMAWHVPSLSLPDNKQLPGIELLSQYEAVRLFIERSTLVQPHFTVTKENAPFIAQICIRLDGIPLAIELAAARVNVLSLEQIDKRLDDRFRLLTGGARTAQPRQQTLRALIDWSYNLLSEEERLLFRRLAVFGGGWTMEAAEAVCGEDGLDPYAILDLVSQLVKKSILVMEEEAGQARYRTLETIRQYAREKLFETDEAARLRDRHAAYFREQAEQGYEGLRGPDDLRWLERLDAEYDNLRAALGWLLESPKANPLHALQLSGALAGYWDTRGYTTEGYQWLLDSLKKAPDAPTVERCRALLVIGWMCERLSRYDKSIQYAREALDLARQLNHAPLLIESQAYYSWRLDDSVEAKKNYEESRALARSARQPYLLATLLVNGMFVLLPNPAEATNMTQEALEIAEELGNARLRASALHSYGRNQMLQGRYALAKSRLLEALQTSQQLKDKHATADCLLILGLIASRQADHANASRYMEDSLPIFRDMSDQGCAARAAMWLGWNDFLAGQLERAKEWAEETLAFIQKKDTYVPQILRTFILLGWIAELRGDMRHARECLHEALRVGMKPVTFSVMWQAELLAMGLEGVCALPSLPVDQAARLWGKAFALRAESGFPVPSVEQPLLDAALARLQADLSPDELQAAQANGAALTDEQAIDAAIEALQKLN